MDGGDASGGGGADGAAAPSALEAALGPAGAMPMSAEDSLSKGLEVQKFRLLSQIALNKKVKAELEQKIKAAEAKALEKQKRLGEYNALFMKMGEAANEKAPSQKLGAREAVMGTKKIIDREIGKSAKECAVTEMQLNKTKARNAHLRVHVDALRKEHMTFKKLFVAMSEELAAVKSRIANTKRAIDEGYAARDRAQEEMMGASQARTHARALARRGAARGVRARGRGLARRAAPRRARRQRRASAAPAPATHSRLASPHAPLFIIARHRHCEAVRARQAGARAGVAALLGRHREGEQRGHAGLAGGRLGPADAEGGGAAAQDDPQGPAQNGQGPRRAADGRTEARRLQRGADAHPHGHGLRGPAGHGRPLQPLRGREVQQGGRGQPPRRGD
jgi:hypothetical protein